MEGAALYSTLNEEETDHFLLFALSVVNASTKGFDKLKESTNKAKVINTFFSYIILQILVHIMRAQTHVYMCAQVF